MVDLLTAHSVRARVSLDCVIKPYSHRIVSLEGYSLESGLSWALKAVEVPHIIILTYGLADVLMRHENAKLLRGEDVFLKVSRGISSTWGHIGAYKGVEVVACARATSAWISSEADPDLINGGNTVFLNLVE